MPHSSRGSRPASPAPQVGSPGSYAIPLVIIRHPSYNFDNQPKRLLLCEQLLPLLVDFALHLELDFTKLDNRIVSFRLGSTHRTHEPSPPLGEAALPSGARSEWQAPQGE
jgi:hypothetical protein